MKKAKLESLWESGKASYPHYVCGKWRVKLYPCWIWWWFVDVKIMYPLGTWVQGYNKAFGFIPWGKFYVSYGNQCLRLKYANGFISDSIRKYAPNEFIGKFYLKGKFLAWFTMQRI